jgi:hypothetical protein
LFHRSPGNTVLTHTLKAPLLAKDARNGAPDIRRFSEKLHLVVVLILIELYAMVTTLL